MRGRDARRTLLPGDWRKRGDEAGAHALRLAGPQHDGRGTMAGAAAAGGEHDVRALGLQPLGDLRTGFVAELIDVAAAAHEAEEGVDQTADNAFVAQFAQSVDGQHGVDVLVDVRVVEAAVGDHQLVARRIARYFAEGVISGRVERRLRLLVDAAGGDEGDGAFAERLGDRRPDGRGRDGHEDLRSKPWCGCQCWHDALLTTLIDD